MEWFFEENRIFAIDDNGDLVCEASYVQLRDNLMDINHTYVRSDLRGQGVGGKLMRTVLEYFRKNEYKTKAMCSYAHEWLLKHKEEYSDIISNDFFDQGSACKIF